MRMCVCVCGGGGGNCGINGCPRHPTTPNLLRWRRQHTQIVAAVVRTQSTPDNCVSAGGELGRCAENRQLATHNWQKLATSYRPATSLGRTNHIPVLQNELAALVCAPVTAAATLLLRPQFR